MDNPIPVIVNMDVRCIAGTEAPLTGRGEDRDLVSHAMARPRLIVVAVHGLNGRGVKEIRFVNHEPESRQQERLVKAIAKVIKAGDIGFSVLRVNNEGVIEGERA
jgi:hypothetical protein